MLHYTNIADIKRDAKAAIDRWVAENLSQDVLWVLERVTCNKYRLTDYTGASAYLVYDINYGFVTMQEEVK